METKTLLEKISYLFEGVDCSEISSVPSAFRGCRVSRIMIARLNRVSNEAVETVDQDDYSLPHVNYYKVREEIDPFLDSSPMILSIMSNMGGRRRSETVAQDAIGYRIPKEEQVAVVKYVCYDKDVFRTKVSSGPTQKISPLKVELVANAKTDHISLCLYSQ